MPQETVLVPILHSLAEEPMKDTNGLFYSNLILRLIKAKVIVIIIIQIIIHIQQAIKRITYTLLNPIDKEKVYNNVYTL